MERFVQNHRHVVNEGQLGNVDSGDERGQKSGTKQRTKKPAALLA